MTAKLIEYRLQPAGPGRRSLGNKLSQVGMKLSPAYRARTERGFRAVALSPLLAEAGFTHKAPATQPPAFDSVRPCSPPSTEQTANLGDAESASSVVPIRTEIHKFHQTRQQVWSAPQLSSGPLQPLLLSQGGRMAPEAAHPSLDMQGQPL